MNKPSNTIYVFLKLNDGLWTRKTPIPMECLRTYYAVPLMTKMSMHAISLAQSLLEQPGKDPCLIFAFKGEVKNGIHVLELVETRNI